MALRPDDANLLYNVACIYCNMNRKAEALESKGIRVGRTPTEVAELMKGVLGE